MGHLKAYVFGRFYDVRRWSERLDSCVSWSLRLKLRVRSGEADEGSTKASRITHIGCVATVVRFSSFIVMTNQTRDD